MPAIADFVTSSVTTQVTGRMFSPSIETIVSVSLLNHLTLLCFSEHALNYFYV